MSYGKPVIASNLKGVRIPIKYTGNGFLYEKGNAEELVECIVSYNKRKKNMNKINIIESYNKHFNKEKIDKLIYKSPNLFADQKEIFFEMIDKMIGKIKKIMSE